MGGDAADRSAVKSLVASSLKTRENDWLMHQEHIAAVDILIFLWGCDGAVALRNC